MAAEKRRSGGPTTSDALGEYREKRDFDRTREPRGEPGKPTPQGAELACVVQKHAARNLHFDLRLELDGVMKSWAVPKGPSLDPDARRLAVHVEDHPMDYNTFEGRIEEGEYGAGSVMIWDRGSWRAPDGSVETLRQGYARGRLTFVLEGERLRGLFHLIRTKSDDTRQEQWLLTKGEDDFADPGRDVVAEVVDSVVTGRT
ncbi:MAG: DNA polymerase ligase N-terminal domain-containing protein, partial [Gemmatimonadota bacterium]